MTTSEAIALVWAWVDRSPCPRDSDEVRVRAREALQWSLSDVRERLAHPRS